MSFSVANESINQTLTEISDFAEKIRLGELFYGQLQELIKVKNFYPIFAIFD